VQQYGLGREDELQINFQSFTTPIMYIVHLMVQLKGNIEKSRMLLSPMNS
jgi:hypothetical protein